MLTTIFFLLFCSILIFIFYKKYKNEKYLKNIPGPLANFFLGNIDILLYTKRQDRLNFGLEMMQKYGKILKLQFGPYFTIVVVSDAKFLEYILSSPKLIDKSEIYEFLHPWIGEGLLTSTGSKWKKRRRMITPAFHFSVIENFVDVFENAGDIFIEKLEEVVGKPSVNICPLVTLCTLDIICEAAMGVKINAQIEKTSEYVKCVKQMCSIVVDRAVSPVHPYLYPLFPNYYKEKRALKMLHNHTDSIINKKIQDIKKNRLKKGFKNEQGEKKKLAFLDLLLDSTIDGRPLSKLDIREEVDTFMFEGHDTVSSTISFALFCLATNPEVQKKAVEEQKRIFTNNLENAKPTVAHLQEMKYLELVIKESLRLYPAIPLLARKLPEDIEFGGTLYPKNLNVMLQVFVTHRDPDYFPNPEKFIPERFDDPNGINSYVYIPFSAGPRNCIGQKFAILELKSVLSKVIRNFELRSATPEHKPLLVPDVVLDSLNGVCIALKKRIEKL